MKTCGAYFLELVVRSIVSTGFVGVEPQCQFLVRTVDILGTCVRRNTEGFVAVLDGLFERRGHDDVGESTDGLVEGE